MAVDDDLLVKNYEGISILFKTGVRISEFVGLTVSDIDFKNWEIIIEHQLQRTRDMQYVIEDTKTSCGVRKISMVNEVYGCFKTIIENRQIPKVEAIIGGKSGVIYLDKNNMPMVVRHWEIYFQHIREKYNSIYKV